MKRQQFLIITTLGLSLTFTSLSLGGYYFFNLKPRLSEKKQLQETYQDLLKEQQQLSTTRQLIQALTQNTLETSSQTETFDNMLTQLQASLADTPETQALKVSTDTIRARFEAVRKLYLFTPQSYLIEADDEFNLERVEETTEGLSLMIKKIESSDFSEEFEQVLLELIEAVDQQEITRIETTLQRSKLVGYQHIISPLYDPASIAEIETLNQKIETSSKKTQEVLDTLQTQL